MTGEPATVRGTIAYEVQCPGRALPRTELPWNSDFPLVLVESREQGAVSIEVTCAVSADPVKTQSDADVIAGRIAREISFRFSCPVGRTVCCSSSIPHFDAEGHLNWTVSTSDTSAWRSSAPDYGSPPASAVLGILAAARDMADPRRDVDLELFRSALSSMDPIARFVLLYTTLQEILLRNQDDLDDWICEKYPAVNETIKPQRAPRTRTAKKRAKETGFTRVRNSLGHDRSQPSFGATLDDARRLVQKLQELVVLAISKKYETRIP